MINPIHKADHFIDYFSDEQNLAVIDKCFNFGVIFSSVSKVSNILEDKIFVITGTLPQLSRKAAKDMIINHGGRVSASVSKKTDFLLCGDNSGSKYNKAQNLNIKIIDESVFREMINE